MPYSYHVTIMYLEKNVILSNQNLSRSRSNVCGGKAGKGIIATAVAGVDGGRRRGPRRSPPSRRPPNLDLLLRRRRLRTLRRRRRGGGRGGRRRSGESVEHSGRHCVPRGAARFVAGSHLSISLLTVFSRCCLDCGVVELVVW